MRRIDLVSATLEGWARLNPQQRERFFKAGLKAALRLDRQGFRYWLLRRVRTPPLAPPIDLADFAISARDMTALLQALDRDLRLTHPRRSQDRPTSGSHLR